MKKLNKRKQWVEDFLQGLIDEEIAKKELDRDAKLRKELEFELLLRKAVSDEEVLRFEEILQKFRSSGDSTHYQRDINEPRALYRRLMAVAAILLLVGGTAIIYLLNNKDDDQIDLYAKAELTAEISRDSSNLTDSVIILTEMGQYSQANAIMEQLTDTLRIDNVHLRGLTRFNAGRHAEAIRDFMEVQQHGDNLFTEDATWYMSISYIHLGVETKARNELQKLIGSDGVYRSKADALLRQLRKSGDVEPAASEQKEPSGNQ